MESAGIKSVEVNGLSLAYREQGTGHPLILIHGGLSDLRAWRSQVEPFSRKYSVIAYSRRSHYPNAQAGYPADYSLKTERDDLVGLIGALGLRTPVHLIGSSYGGYVAMLVARDFPQLVSSLVLGEPPIFALLLANPEISQLHREFKDKLGGNVVGMFEKDDPEGGVRAYMDSMVGPGAFDRMPAEAREIQLQNARTLLVETMTPEREIFGAGDLKRIATPTLLLTGERSPAYLYRITQEIARFRPDFEKVTITNSGHAMHQQNPEMYNTVVLRFLAKYDR